MRDGDALIVTKLDRLARSIKDLWTIIDRLKAKGVSLRVLNLGIDIGAEVLPPPTRSQVAGGASRNARHRQAW